MSAFVYMLRCGDNSIYIGITHRSVDERVSEHQQGLTPSAYTYYRRPVTLMLSEEYDRSEDAVAAERRLKGWSRAKKEAYARGDFAELHALARCRSRASLDTPPDGGGSG